MKELLIILSLFLPVVGGLLSAIFNKPVVAIIGMGMSLIASALTLILGVNLQVTLEWLPGYSLGIIVDDTTLILTCLVIFISLLVHIFSMEYLKDDLGKNRYFAKLGLFTFSMIGLLLADHLILLFIFWELVGLSSYLLIGFWYRKEGVPSSARLAFMVNRVADVALLIGILMLNKDGSLNISEMNGIWLFVPSILMAIGAFGKSAQLPFSGWLTKAMVGPTPVSALIHAATMVAAGVYLLYRVGPFMHEVALTWIAVIGTLTAFYAAVCALFQHDIKKVLAYSTISQLGYMIMGVGVGAGSAAIFHLFTHAFFKAGLFLGAGAIIHYMHQATDKDAQDMRNMGGLKEKMPWTFRAFLICSLALAGIPFFSGFMSKEGIILAGWEWANQTGTWSYMIPDIGLITAFITALYVGRMVLLVFFGQSRISSSVSFTENLQIKLPLVLLALGSIWIFFNWNPLAHETWLQGFWMGNDLPVEVSSMLVMLLSIILSSAGLALAYSFFKPGSTYAESYAGFGQKKLKILLEGLYLVALYEYLGKFVSQCAEFLSKIDEKVVDGILHLLGVGTVVLAKVAALIDRFVVDGPVNLTGFVSTAIGDRLAGLSSRSVQAQMMWLIVGVILILIWILFF
ncbi:NADH-quinone oxidoreductase subunit L [Ekhidna sp.]|uniref:NADH-quinone oxidoreductase subunit 5 family protein n=1 Tax=Ekhidna sp. TaxID=2608089 RepID=UPI0035123164